MTNFAFLQPEWPQVFAAASRAEALVYPDPRAACFYARRSLELAVQWLYKAERSLTLPYQDTLAALLAEPSFAALATPRIVTKGRLEKYSDPAAWEQMGIPEQGELVREVAGLPSGIADSDLDAKQFDAVILNLQLAILRIEPQFDALKDRVIEIGSALEEKQAIPMVREQILLIQDVQRTQFWQSITLPELERVRLRLRALVKFIDKGRRQPIYSNFEDQMRGAQLIPLTGVSVGVDTERFREKALDFLRDKLDEPALHKVRWNEPLTAADLEALEAMLVQAGVGSSAQIEEVARQENGLGLFLRSLVGLDRAAAKRAFDGFIHERPLNASQLDFINLVIEHLTQCGWMKPEQLYSSPFTDEFSAGPNSVFSEPQAVQALIATLNAVQENASGTAGQQ